MKWIFYVLPLLAGIAMTIQSGVNSQLRQAIQQPVLAAFISFLGGTSFLALILLLSRQGLPSLQQFSQVQWYKFTGGLLGAFVVTSVILSVQRVGAANMFVIILAGQLGTALLMDQFGILGMRHNPVTAMKLMGIALVVIGAWMVNKR